eukprot:1291437-Amphidinium_carterae.1
MWKKLASKLRLHCRKVCLLGAWTVESRIEPVPLLGFQAVQVVTAGAVMMLYLIPSRTAALP